MDKRRKGSWIFRLLALGVCLAVIGCFLSLWQPMKRDTPARAQRQLVTVWMYGDRLNASSWVRKQAAVYQKAHQGVNVWVRTVTEADIKLLEEDFAHAAPDVLLFMADAEIEEAWTQQTQPVCMAGYALVTLAQTAATVAPTSLFGVTPVPELNAAATPVPREVWPQLIAADDALGAYFLQQMHAPANAQLLPSEALQAALEQKEAEAALLSTLQIRALVARGVGVELLCAAPGSDLVMFASVLNGAETAAVGFWQDLQAEPAQRALADSGLFSPQIAGLYGSGTPVLQVVEAALRTGWQPSAFLWPQEKSEKIHLGQMLYTAK